MPKSDFSLFFDLHLYPQILPPPHTIIEYNMWQEAWDIQYSQYYFKFIHCYRLQVDYINQNTSEIAFRH